MTFVRRSTGASSRLPQGKHGKMPVPRERRRRRSIGAVVFILAAAIVMLRPTPFAQGGDGRDHNGGSFVTWLAGGGVKAGVAYGQSDDWGWKAAEGKTFCYDLHATILHLLGIDHTKLTWRHNGIDRRLTDVHGRVVEPILG